MLKSTMLIFLSASLGLTQNLTMPLWPEEILDKPYAKEIRDTSDILRISNINIPDIAVYLPSLKNTTGQAVIICPGGGYRILAYNWEGSDIAKWFNSIGIAAIVLKYRLPDLAIDLESHKYPLSDAQRAIRLARYYADEWHIDKEKIGIMGFSAGGHLASTAATHFDSGELMIKDPVDALSARPDFMILIYPVITFSKPAVHSGSRKALIGENPSAEQVNYYSNELHVKSDSPPAFIIHATDDRSVPVENSLLFYQALNDNGVDVEMHIYAEGGHGFSLALGKGYLASWIERCSDWLKKLNNLKPGKGSVKNRMKK